MAYATIQDLRDEGITEEELSDARATELLDGWSKWIDNMTGQFFDERAATIDFDGDGSRTLFLPVPIITCTNLWINDDFTTAIDTDRYVVYNSRSLINDDRKNPKITLKISKGSIFTTILPSKFVIGDRNQRVEGTWGYTEADGSTPNAISRAVIILVAATAELIGDAEESDLDQLKFGRIQEEVTDRHRIEYSDLYDRLQAWMPTGITEVDMVLRKYKAPNKIAAPRTMFGLV